MRHRLPLMRIEVRPWQKRPFRAVERVYLVAGLIFFAGGLFTSHIAEGDVSQRQTSDLPDLLLQLRSLSGG